MEKFPEDVPCLPRDFRNNFSTHNDSTDSKSFEGGLQKMICHKYFIRRLKSQRERMERMKVIVPGYFTNSASRSVHSLKSIDPQKSRGTKGVT